MQAAVLGQSPLRPALHAADGAPLLTSNPTLQASLERIARGSSLWREAFEALRGTRRTVLVLTPDQVVVADTPDGETGRPFDPAVLAAVAPIPRQDSQVREVLVVVNLPLIQEIHDRRRSLAIELDMDVDRILVHEVYGHALPYLLAGDLSGRCADPAPGQPASEACSVRRENAVRAELRLGRRTEYGLDGLWLARTGSTYENPFYRRF